MTSLILILRTSASSPDCNKRMHCAVSWACPVLVEVLTTFWPHSGPSLQVEEGLASISSLTFWSVRAGVREVLRDLKYVRIRNPDLFYSG